ncbi:MAG: TRAP transporter small permease [Candidatus Puniceispirillaceae bacterium]|jgi:TRAP-type C4-dicarboxylate transport system permease small subunit|nr:TRAP transporter small permease [Alphaproteobacteria bacterium]
MWAFLEKHFEELLAGILVMIMASMVFFQVVMRYLFSMPTSWSDEIAIYAMLWSVYVSVAWAVRERAHIRVMNFVQLFPKKIAIFLTILSDFIWFLFGIFLTYQSVLLDLSFWENAYRSPALDIDQKWPYMCLILGFGLMTLRLVQIYYRWIKYGEPILEPRDEENLPHA